MYINVCHKRHVCGQWNGILKVHTDKPKVYSWYIKGYTKENLNCGFSVYRTSLSQGLWCYLLSFYLWLLRAFLVQFLFPLVNKFVNLLAVLYYCVYVGKTLSQYLVSFNLYFLFILFFIIFIYFHILRTVVSSAPKRQYCRSRLFYFTLCYLFCCYILSG